MANFIQLEDGSFVHADLIQRIRLEKHVEPKFWRLQAHLSPAVGGEVHVYLAGEFDSVKEAEAAVRKLGR